LSIIIGILTNFIRFSEFIKTHRIDIVHGNDLRINLSWSLPAKFFSRGFVWHQRTLLSTSKFWLLIRFLCTYFVAISDEVMQSAPGNLQNHRKKIVYNPFNITPMIDKELSRGYVVKKYNIPSDCFLLGCVGRIVNYKNIDFAIKNIFDIRHRLNKNVCLIIVGTGSDEYVNELKKYAYNIGVSSHIIFTGFISNPNKMISSLDLLIAPSCVDAFGRTIVEAMLQKTPVLAAKSGGHLSIINEGVNGMFYDPTTQYEFSDKISSIMDNKDMTVLTNKAYYLAQTNFSSKRHLSSILSIYHNLS
jgi:glycosyltransferase involved in cell wall biosynthesis